MLYIGPAYDIMEVRGMHYPQPGSNMRGVVIESGTKKKLSKQLEKGRKRDYH